MVPASVSETDNRRAAASYCAMAEMMDSHFGESIAQRHGNPAC